MLWKLEGSFISRLNIRDIPPPLKVLELGCLLFSYIAKNCPELVSKIESNKDEDDKCLDSRKVWLSTIVITVDSSEWLVLS